MKIALLEKQNLGMDLDYSGLEKLGETVYYDNASQAETQALVSDVDILLVNKVKINEAVLKDAPKLRLICECATGTDNIDLNDTKRRGIPVCNVRGYSTATVAQHTFALLFYVMEKLNSYDAYVKSGEYTESGRFTCLNWPFMELEGKTWGIIGLGEIGKKVAGIAKAFGCRVMYYSTSGKNTNLDFEQADFNKLLKESDIVSVHAPLTEKTRNLMDKEAFGKMKPTAYFINVGRGPIVEEEALAEALEEGRLAGAALDVVSTEPMKADNPLFRIKDSGKLVITPHIAWASREARQRLIDEVVKNIEAFLMDEKRNLVE